MELGIRSVMYDASALPHAENMHATSEITLWCHEREVSVEAELDEIGGKAGVHVPGARTDPSDAGVYVEKTGVDALAVAVGSSHAMLTRDAKLDDELIAAIAAQVSVPLVIHGSSGVPHEGFLSAIAAGVTKINIATHLNAAMTAAVRGALETDALVVDPRKYLGPGRAAAADEVARAAHRPGRLLSTGCARHGYLWAGKLASKLRAVGWPVSGTARLGQEPRLDQRGVPHDIPAEPRPFGYERMRRQTCGRFT